MKNFFQELFEYNHQSNSKIIQLVQDKEEPYSEKAAVLLSHMLNAHHIWNARILRESNKHTVWQTHSLESSKLLDWDNFEMTKFVLGTKELFQKIGYTNSKGDTFQNTVQDILFHIINHSTYHRGQLMSELKLQGFTPISTDFIFYKR